MSEEQANPMLYDPIKDLGPGHRPFFVDIEQINISWSWNKNQPDPIATINGIAKCERDGVRATDNKNIYKEFKFQLTGQDDIEKIWIKEKEMRISIRKLMLFKYQKSIIESIAIFDSTKDNYFDSKSPTARLHIIEPEPKFLYKGEIVLHCIIPLHVFKKVLQDFSEKNSHAIRATISWTFQFIEDPQSLTQKSLPRLGVE